MSKRFALINIRDMNFHERDGDPGQRIAQGNAGMGQAARIDDDGIDPFRSRGMDAVDQCAFMVALKADQVGTGRHGLRHCCLLDIGQGAGAVDLWLARSQQIQVGTVEQKEVFAMYGRPF